MSEHDIEELRRQHEQAVSRLDQARAAERLASKRLHDAQCRASGFMGKVVTHHKVSVLVHDVRFYGRGEAYAVRGFRLKKDGLPGLVESTVWIGEPDLQISDFKQDNGEAAA